jgi:hypothetical protein
MSDLLGSPLPSLGVRMSHGSWFSGRSRLRYGRRRESSFDRHSLSRGTTMVKHQRLRCDRGDTDALAYDPGSPSSQCSGNAQPPGVEGAGRLRVHAVQDQCPAPPGAVAVGTGGELRGDSRLVAGM